jgi:hypothetical protein
MLATLLSEPLVLHRFGVGWLSVDDEQARLSHLGYSEIYPARKIRANCRPLTDI